MGADFSQEMIDNPSVGLDLSPEAIAAYQEQVGCPGPTPRELRARILGPNAPPAKPISDPRGIGRALQESFRRERSQEAGRPTYGPTILPTDLINDNTYSTNNQQLFTGFCSAYSHIGVTQDNNATISNIYPTPANTYPTTPVINFPDQVRWPNNSPFTVKGFSCKVSLRIAFQTGASEFQRNEVETIAEQWIEHTSIKFDWIRSNQLKLSELTYLPDMIDTDPYHIIIDFRPDGGNWSCIGRQSAVPAKRGHTTMNLARVQPTVHPAIRRQTILHEFGHALGLVHEHSNVFPNSDFVYLQWNKEAVYQSHQGSWDRQTVDKNIFSIATGALIRNDYFDADSIMLYSFPAAWTLNNVASKLNTELSEGDKRCIALAYPEYGFNPFEWNVFKPSTLIEIIDRSVVPEAPELNVTEHTISSANALKTALGLFGHYAGFRAPTGGTTGCTEEALMTATKIIINRFGPLGKSYPEVDKWVTGLAGEWHLKGNIQWNDTKNFYKNDTVTWEVRWDDGQGLDVLHPVSGQLGKGPYVNFLMHCHQSGTKVKVAVQAKDFNVDMVAILRTLNRICDYSKAQGFATCEARAIQDIIYYFLYVFKEGPYGNPQDASIMALMP